MTIVKTVRRTIRHHDLIPPRTRLVLAVSGGADSLTLLHILIHLSDAFSCQLHVATLDHQLRGDAGADDARFVEAAAREWSVPVTCGQADVRKLMRETGLSLEAAARKARYDFLASVARQVNATHIAVAHHASDQAETVLMRLLRGTGLAGLSGMAFQSPLPGHPDLKLIRPLLGVTRAQIEAYCHEHNLLPRQDESNVDTAFLRNRIRREIMPRLQGINPQVDRALIQLADIAAVENHYLEQQLNQVIQANVTITARRITIQREAFQHLHPALQRRYVHWAATHITGTDTDLAYQHIVAAVRLGTQGQVGSAAQLTSRVHLRVDYDRLIVEHEAAPPLADNMPLLPADSVIPLNTPGSTPMPGGWMLTAELGPGKHVQARLAIPPASRCVLRVQRTGDRFAPLGLEGHTKKLTRWMIDHKIPQRLRDHLPLLVVDGQVAAILTGANWPISEVFAIREKNQRILYFSISRNF